MLLSEIKIPKSHRYRNCIGQTKFGRNDFAHLCLASQKRDNAKLVD